MLNFHSHDGQAMVSVRQVSVDFSMRYAIVDADRQGDRPFIALYKIVAGSAGPKAHKFYVQQKNHVICSHNSLFIFKMGLL